MFEVELIYFIILLAFLVMMFFITSNNIVDIILFNSVFSLLTVVMYVTLDAPDVAMTEAAVGILASIFSIYAVRSIYQSSYKFKEQFKPLLFITLMLSAAVFIYASYDLPEFGKSLFSNYYLENTGRDIGIDSTVTAILADYRGYDTLLETMVILIGGLSVFLVHDQFYTEVVEHDQLVSKLTRFIFPIIIVFALYIQTHGEISPGGGFQAGSIIAIAFILYSMVFGNNDLLQLFSLAALKNIAVFGVGLYFITGLFGLLGDLEFLNYNAFADNQILAQKIGIIVVELGVGISVAATMLLIYFCLASSDYASDKYKL